MAHLLIYGGSGIISMEIAALAIQNGHKVTMVNRGQRKAHIAPQAECIIADIRSEPLEKLCKKIPGYYDAVFDFLSYTIDELKRNTAIVKNRCQQYIFVSSATVYNDKEKRYTEQDPIGESKWDYAVQKAVCEAWLAQNAQKLGFTYTIIRPYVTYGKTRIPFQFAPLEYYTLIHRMRSGKAIPLLEDKVTCTLTNAKDFAVGAIGLVGQPKAYGQTFHITGAYETTWKQALLQVADAFGVHCDIVELPKSVFLDAKLIRGLNAAEVVGDKGRDMLFDNRKIKMVVPEFTGIRTLQDSLPEIVTYFSETAAARTVNFAWDGRCDHMLSASKRISKEQKRKLHYYPCEHRKWKEYLVYMVGRYDCLFYTNKCLKKLLVMGNRLFGSKNSDKMYK